MVNKHFFSICIPAYNRTRYLRPLLDSILSQNFKDFEIVICEDCSPERELISAIVCEYQALHKDVIHYYQNPINLGYDGNIRNLVEKASGKFCFFMGNDDLICEGALSEVAGLIGLRNDVGMVLKSYAWFNDTPDNIAQTVRYFAEDCEFKAGRQAIHACFRRSGVISGYIINRDAAFEVATSEFDGSLFYQMHLTAWVLAKMNAIFTRKILVLCRNGVPPEFGNSGSEKGKYIPGSFTAQARLSMVEGSISIIKNLKTLNGTDVVDDVLSDYANYFYPYIRDQLNLSIPNYWKLYRSYSRMGFVRYPMFHIYSVVAYILGQKNFDWMIKQTYRILGHSLILGKI